MNSVERSRRASPVRSRHPEEIESLGRSLTRAIAEETLRKTEEVAQWLLSMLK